MGNSSNKWNEVNYAKELKNTKNFVLAHDMVRLKLSITDSFPIDVLTDSCPTGVP